MCVCVSMAGPGRFVVCGRMLTWNWPTKKWPCVFIPPAANVSLVSSDPFVSLAGLVREETKKGQSAFHLLSSVHLYIIFSPVSLFAFCQGAVFFFSVVPPGYSFRADTHLSIIYTRRTLRWRCCPLVFLYTRPYITQPGEHAWPRVISKSMHQLFFFFFCFLFIYQNFMFSLTWKISNGSHSFSFLLLSVATLSPSRKAAGGPFFFPSYWFSCSYKPCESWREKRRRI